MTVSAAYTTSFTAITDARERDLSHTWNCVFFMVSSSLALGQRRHASLGADPALVPSVKLNPAIPGLAMAKGPNEKPRLDFGPDIDTGIISKALPVALKDRYGVLVPSVDADGNETAGLALPDITVPTGTAMGWSVRSEFGGGTGELCYLDGAFIPFAKTRAEREATNDPRPSLAERYRDNADYSERVKPRRLRSNATATCCRKTPSASSSAPRS